MAVGLVVLPPSAPAEAFDVYTTPGTHVINGREWRTACEKYSTTVERCRTEIKANTIVLSGGRFVEKYTWAFNNLTYKPSPRAQWAGNILATPGEHVSAGRRWKTECDTAWTGRGGCRAMIWTNSYLRTSSGFTTKWQWVFNNIVRFSDGGPTAEFCVPAKSSVAGVRVVPRYTDQGALTADTDTSAPEPPDRHSGPEETARNESPNVHLGPEETASNETPDRHSGSGGTSAESPEPDGAAMTEPAEQEAEDAGAEPTAGGTPVEDVPRYTDQGAPTPGTETSAPQPPDRHSGLGESASDESPDRHSEPAAAAVVIASVRHPHYAGGLYDRLGTIEVTGTVAGAPDGSKVTVQLRDASGKVRSEAGTSLAGGAYGALVDGGFSGAATVTVTTDGGATAQQSVELLKANATLTGSTRIDPLGSTTISGRVTPGIGNVPVEAHVAVAGGWIKAGSGRTSSDGSYRLTYGHGAGTLGSSQVRVCATLPWGATIPSSASMNIERARIANPVVTNTTSAEVASTYRSGCPVGPSGLSTIRINQQSMDGRVYRGEIIVRRARAAEVVDVFTRTFEAGFPVYQMTNPNAFGGDDIAMMAANNTSGFNCRHVVGNPYRLSPHSYGYAVDVNPWQNPYRDPTGKWHPSTAHVSRTPVVPGMLTTTSAPVKAFQSHGWSWFSGWDWHHFEKR